MAKAMLSISASPGFYNVDDTGFLAGVQDGSVIAGVSGVWNAVAVKEAWGDDYGAAKLPTYTCAGKQIQMASFSGINGPASWPAGSQTKKISSCGLSFGVRVPQTVMPPHLPPSRIPPPSPL